MNNIYVKSKFEKDFYNNYPILDIGIKHCDFDLKQKILFSE